MIKSQGGDTNRANIRYDAIISWTAFGGHWEAAADNRGLFGASVDLRVQLQHWIFEIIQLILQQYLRVLETVLNVSDKFYFRPGKNSGDTPDPSRDLTNCSQILNCPNFSTISLAPYRILFQIHFNISIFFFYFLVIYVPFINIVLLLSPVCLAMSSLPNCVNFVSCDLLHHRRWLVYRRLIQKCVAAICFLFFFFWLFAWSCYLDWCKDSVGISECSNERACEFVLFGLGHHLMFIHLISTSMQSTDTSPLSFKFVLVRLYVCAPFSGMCIFRIISSSSIVWFVWFVKCNRRADNNNK